MHKYQPRFHVILVEPELELGHQVDDITQGDIRENMRTFVFQETQFMAVTAYQNHMVRWNPIVLVSYYFVRRNPIVLVPYYFVRWNFIKENRVFPPLIEWIISHL